MSLRWPDGVGRPQISLSWLRALHRDLLRRRSLLVADRPAVRPEQPPGTRVLALAPLAVEPEHQRRGVGTALMREGLARADQSGESLVIVLGDPRYYRRFGFETAERFAIHAPFRVLAGEFMVKPLGAYRRELRGLAIYPPTFAEVT